MKMNYFLIIEALKRLIVFKVKKALTLEKNPQQLLERSKILVKLTLHNSRSYRQCGGV